MIVMGQFGGEKIARHSPYLVEQIDDRWYVGIPPDDIVEARLSSWCEQMIGDPDEAWGLDYDEFYSPLSCGLMFWFADETSFDLFRMAWCL